MTEKEALSLLMAMGYTVAISGGSTFELSDLLASVDESSDAVVDFWPSHINLWRVSETNSSNIEKRMPSLVIHKQH